MTTPSDQPDIGELIRQEQELLLSLLRAEMQALTILMPGMVHPAQKPDQASDDAETEASFDNMPV